MEQSLSKRNIGILTGILLALLAAAGLLLRTDFPYFLRWYLTIVILGIGFYPVTACLFDGFDDHGWIFSKALALAVCGYAAWMFVTSGLQQFTSRRCIVITLIAFGICWVCFMERSSRRTPRVELILFEEILFLAVFLMWTYFVIFRPEARGTEKYMDYGFLVSMERSLTLPPKDMWYGMANINYYYGGQYYAAYLSKLCYVPVRYSYNLMRTAVAAFTFVMPFSIVYHMLQLRLQKGRHTVGWSLTGGLVAGTAVSLAGNVHYVLYKLFDGFLHLPAEKEYWFPNSTRYIGSNPHVLNDECIHEFPSYSFVLGDLHAHMIDLIFVLTIVALLYAWIRQVRALELDRVERDRIREEQQRRRPSKFEARKNWRIFLKRNGAEPQLLAAACLIGLCKWTNYWDFVIYFTVAMFVCAMAAFYRYQSDARRLAASMLLHAAEVWILAEVVPLPFMLSFDAMNSGVGLSVYHTQPYQLLVLWGLPAAVFLVLAVVVIRQYAHDYPKIREEDTDRRSNAFLRFFRFAPQSDRFALILGICACGLVMVPEVVYVKDIYGDGLSRVNTMFKMTYQAYVLFGILMGYALVRLIVLEKKAVTKSIGIALLAVLGLTVGYFPYSVKCWFGYGGPLKWEDRKGLDATGFIYEVYPEDAGAIDWLRTYVKEQPLVLEAEGNSYSDYCRVSAVTGLPTLVGWYAHEWLWRGDTTDLDAKTEDIRRIYEAAEPNDAAVLLARYGIRYVFVGSCEREKYAIQDDVLQQLGEVIYEEGTTYIVEIE